MDGAEYMTQRQKYIRQKYDRFDLASMRLKWHRFDALMGFFCGSHSLIAERRRSVVLCYAAQQTQEQKV